MRIRGAASNSVTRDPKALKIEASWTPVAPAPITSIEGGVEVRVQASLWVHASSKPGRSSRRDMPPVQMMVFAAWRRGACAHSITCGSVNRGDAGVLVKRDSGLLEVFAQQRVRAHVVGDLADAVEQPPIVERGFAGGDAVARELRRLRGSAGRHAPTFGRAPVRRWRPFPRTRSRVTSAVRAPSRAARSAATTPAGPAPITTTSWLVAPAEVMATIFRFEVRGGVPRFG